MNKEKLKNLLDSLTLDEKIGQLVQINGYFFSDDEVIATGPKEKIGIHDDMIYRCGSIINTYGTKKVKAIQDKYLEKSEKKIPLLFMADMLNGYKTAFPNPLAMACSFDEKLMKKVAKTIATEGAISGVRVTFSPMVDLIRDARWGRVMESFSEDPYMNSKMAKAMVEGYQENVYPLASCVKHYAAYGAPIGGVEYGAVELGKRSLFNDFLPGYKGAIDAGCQLVMPSFNTIDGIPVTSSSYMLRDVLRNKLGFNGVTISDHSAIRELIAHGVASNDAQAAKLAIEAGCDIDMMTSIYANQLKKLVEDGNVDEKYINEACMRVLELKNSLGLFENPYGYADEELEQKKLMCEEHQNLAIEVIKNSCVLLKNKNKILPLNKTQNIALVGPFADFEGLYGMWSFTSDLDQVVTIKDGIEKIIGKDYLKTYTTEGFLDKNVSLSQIQTMNLKVISENPEQDIQEIKEVTTQSDIIIAAIGEHPLLSGEGASKTDLSFPKVQVDMLKELKQLQKPVIALVFGGRPLIIKDIEPYCDAIMQCWLPGTKGGDGIAQLLYGEANPSGRLTVSFPYSTGQCPIYYNHLSTGRPNDGSDNRFVSKYLDNPTKPLYPFGYGLSYTQFEYSSLCIDKETYLVNDIIKVDVDIHNNGSYDGHEIVQLYIQDVVGSIARPVKELKGFQKVYIPKGEKKSVHFEIPIKELEFMNKDYQQVVEPGQFHLFVGKNSDECLKTSFWVEEEYA